jgi:hypothetical protein
VKKTTKKTKEPKGKGVPEMQTVLIEKLGKGSSVKGASKKAKKC